MSLSVASRNQTRWRSTFKIGKHYVRICDSISMADNSDVDDLILTPRDRRDVDRLHSVKTKLYSVTKGFPAGGTSML